MTTKKVKKSGMRESFSENFSAFKTLVRMQLKEKMDFGYTRSLRSLIFKIVWLFIEFVAITAIIAVIFFAIKLLGLLSLVHDIPVSFVSLVFSVMLLLSLITDTIGLVKSLYFSKDNTVLLTFPATSSFVFLSKLATYYVYELRKSFMSTIPMFIAYGIVKGFALYYYPWIILMFALISTIPVLFSALLSIPAMFGYMFLNRFKVIKYILYVAIVGGAVLILWTLIGLVPDNINFVETWGDTYWEIQAFLTNYTKTFAPLYAFTELIVGKTVGLSSVIFHSETFMSLLVLIVTAIVLLAACMICSKPLFYKMASTPFEFKKKNAVAKKHNRKHAPFASAVKKEFVVGYRSGLFTRLAGTLIIVMPMLIFLLNKLYAAMNTRTLGTQMTICFNIVIMLLVLLMTNIDIASVYSRDGASSYLNKVQPAPYAKLLVSKLIFPMIIALFGVIFSVNIFAIVSGFSRVEATKIGVLIYSVYVAHLFSAAESDIMNPQYKQYETFSSQSNNPNEAHAGISAIVISAVVFAVALFLSSRADAGVWLKLAIVGICFKISPSILLRKIQPPKGLGAFICANQSAR